VLLKTDMVGEHLSQLSDVAAKSMDELMNDDTVEPEHPLLKLQ